MRKAVEDKEWTDLVKVKKIMGKSNKNTPKKPSNKNKERENNQEEG